MTALFDKHRPKKLDDVIGQGLACEVLRKAIAADTSHAFLLSGPSGVGKTTLARIGAHMLEAEIQEIPAAIYTGIDAMREVIDRLHYMPIGGAEHKALIIDEAARLSKPTWDSLLKIVEEPPEHVYWFFCTTEPDKVPATIRNRCTELKLLALSVHALNVLLHAVTEREQMVIDHATIELIAREAMGSARKALVLLPTVVGLDYVTARGVLRDKSVPRPVGDLCKVLMNGGSWLQAMKIVASMHDDPETYRIQISNYLAAVLRDAKTDKDATFLLNILEQFSEPYHPGERQAPLMISIGRVLYV